METDQDHTTIDIIDDELVSSFRQKLLTLSGFPTECCIFRVHDNLRSVNERMYIPRLVSIGPFHHHRENLKGMEQHKWLYLKSFLHRSPINLEEYVESIRKLERRMRACYAENLTLTSNEFVGMMLLDGCFLIELFMKYRFAIGRERGDPIFNTSWMLTSLNHDLVLLENQLPFFVLEHLFILNQVDPYQDPLSYLTESALGFFTWTMPTPPNMNSEQKCDHLLDLIRLSLLPSLLTKSSKSLRTLKRIPCATKLRQYGIKFKKCEDKNLLGIKFSNGVLEIPPLEIHDLTEPLFRNIMALEQYRRDTQFTSYASLMDSLINSTNDVAFLRHHGIIDNWLGSEEDVCLLFNKLCVDVNLENFYYAELCEQVNGYCKSKWHEWRGALKRDYFQQPMGNSLCDCCYSHYSVYLYADSICYTFILNRTELLIS